MEYGILSLIPPVLAIGLAIYTKNVLLSLFVAVFCGATILAGGNPYVGLTSTIRDYMVEVITDYSNAPVLVTMAIIGGFVVLIEKSGAGRSFANAVTKSINNRVKAQISCWIAGIILFFSDSGNSLMLGPVFAPIFDRLKISRQKLAYLCDSTASPVCILVHFIGWGEYIMNLIHTEYEVLGIAEHEFTAWINALPYQFYAITCLLIIPIIALTGKEFGPMAKAEHAAFFENNISNDNDINMAAESNGKSISVAGAVIPFVAIFVVLFGTLIYHGFPKPVPGKVMQVALAIGYIFGIIALFIAVTRERIMTFNEAFDVFISGVKEMAFILAILDLAWSMGAICKNVGTAGYLISLTQGFLTPVLIPLLIFIVGCLTSFATGTSWGTFAILMPIAIPMAHHFGVPIHAAIGAVLSGGLFGDHCAPISDTTILASMASGCDPIEHVRTQLPYAVICAIASGIGYVVAVITNSAIISLAVTIVALLAIYFFASKTWGETIPTAKNVHA